ncbi:cell division control protein 4 [Abortiporus biennis]|nr:cell division control protein 4 [Abortiporus biennis]
MKPIDYSQVFAKSRQLTRIPLVIRYKDRNRVTIPTHGRSVVTCLMLSQGNIITASDDATIHVYDASNGRLIHSFEGHVGGVWAIERYQNVLVSGSTDRTVRVWDLEEGRCTHIFSGHTSSVRALTIIKPEWIDMEDEEHGIRREMWPKRPLIVTGSRDHTLRVWTLPDPRSDMEYGLNASESEEYVESNPYHIFHLEGHEHAVRCLAAKGRTLVSGSYDNTLRVWDLVTGHCAFTLRGHTDRVYAVALDHKKHLVCSSSMDGTIIGWNVLTGEQLYTLNGHTSLVGILALSPSHIVSGSADATIRVWDPDTLQPRWTFKTANSVTPLQHDQSKIVYGSDGILSVLDIEHGTHTRNLHLSGSIWQVAFDDRWCVAASSSSSDFTFLDIWDFSDSKEWTGRT